MVESRIFSTFANLNHHNMKKYTLFILGMLLSANYIIGASRNESILRMLDEVVEQRQQYIEQKESHIRQLKSLYFGTEGRTKYDIGAEIYKLYNGLNTDSALLYSQLCEEAARELGDKKLIQQAQIYQSQCYSINCMFERAKALLDAMESHVDESNLCAYYKACNSLCFWEAEFSTVNEEKEKNWIKTIEYRHAILSVEQNPIWRAQEEALILAEQAPLQALNLLKPVFDSLPENDDYARYLANSLGSFYGKLNQSDSALIYYAISAITDLEHGIMEHASLREAALILFRQGDIERAYRYMNCCIEDAQLCKARLRTIEMAGDMPVILEAYQNKINKQQARQRWHIAILIFAVIMLFLLALFALIARRRQAMLKEKVTIASEQLKTANEQLKQSLLQLEESNQSLRDSNRIRSAYVTQYMKECSEAIEKLGIYHKQLLRTAMNSNYEKLIAAIKSTDFIDENLRTFYLHFDETFLSLFPHFVEQFNRLLGENAQFDLPQNNKLSTELRIFALIRLGITDSDDIARFLRLSTKTVYNYRAAVRNRAAGNRDQLEDKVMQIGL